MYCAHGSLRLDLYVLLFLEVVGITAETGFWNEVIHVLFIVKLFKYIFQCKYFIHTHTHTYFFNYKLYIYIYNISSEKYYMIHYMLITFIVWRRIMIHLYQCCYQRCSHMSPLTRRRSFGKKGRNSSSKAKLKASSFLALALIPLLGTWVNIQM